MLLLLLPCSFACSSSSCYAPPSPLRDGEGEKLLYLFYFYFCYSPPLCQAPLLAMRLLLLLLSSSSSSSCYVHFPFAILLLLLLFSFTSLSYYAHPPFLPLAMLLFVLPSFFFSSFSCYHLPNTLLPFSPLQFRHTDTQRTTESFKAFAGGLFGDSTVAKAADIPDEDLLLRPYDYCSSFKDKNYKSEGSEYQKYRSSAVWNNTMAEIAKRLG